MATKTEELDDVYGAKSPDETRRIYNRWSESYDADNLSRGFRLPPVGAGLLARHLGPADGPVLDAGCGTGLAGEALKILGYERLIGCDLSPDMLSAAQRTGAYAELHEADLGKPLPFAADHFAGFICVGSFGPGHAPPISLVHLAHVTRSGGYGVFNLIEATFADQGFPPVMAGLESSGAWEIVQRTEPFLPFLLGEPDLWTRAYVVRMR
ncbi:class I SAM-dependent methyltransferase [Roseovarius sp. CAU 1744]|uniref:class I SAM-dependent DNA methyltransferase n=1 Tax=Roseovarius sp. CAU 1744 TaxID=3140368 RepID=UPI00325B3195